MGVWRCPGPAGYVVEFSDEGNIVGIGFAKGPLRGPQIESTASWRGSGKIFGDKLQWVMQDGRPGAAIIRVWRVVALFDGRVKRIHVDMNDLSLPLGGGAAPPMLSGSTIIPSDPIPYHRTGPTGGDPDRVCLPNPTVGPPRIYGFPDFEGRVVKALCRLPPNRIGRDRMFTRRSGIHSEIQIGIHRLC
jgi:hypothetical protein